MEVLDRILEYARKCISGEIASGQKHKWACERLIRDVQRIGSEGFPYVWDDDAAQNIIEWFALLRHSKGVLAGEPIILTDWQCFRLCQLYGWKHKDTGKRRFKKTFTEVARKNAKSQEEAGVALYEISVTAVKNNEVAEAYTAGTKKDQSRIVFEEAKLMLRGSPLRTKFNLNRSEIVHRKTGSFIKPLSKEDGKTGDGTNPALLILD
jgi:phage terminase large subunit-like protein